MNRCTLLLSLCLATGLAARAADSAESNDTRLREALRSATLQLRAAETDRANLQSAQATLAEEHKALAEKFETLRKQAVAERTADGKSIAALKAQTAAQQADIAQLKEALAKSEAEARQAAALATAKETEQAKLASAGIALQQKLNERERQNLALFQIGNEILTRYEKFSLGEALAAREPFVGRTRTRLENLVQEYQDKLAAQRTKP